MKLRPLSLSLRHVFAIDNLDVECRFVAAADAADGETIAEVQLVRPIRGARPAPSSRSPDPPPDPPPVSGAELDAAAEADAAASDAADL